jgi:hypothetical protein
MVAINMTFMPAHKDTKHPAGQIRNDITLAYYIARKQEAYSAVKRKLSFDEWWAKNWPCEDVDMCRIIWNAAQDNVPSQSLGKES